GVYWVAVDGKTVGIVFALNTATRGDLLVGPFQCSVFYGVVSDAPSHRALAGAKVEVSGRTAVTGPDGWYRLDFGCSESSIPFSIGTRFGRITVPEYGTYCIQPPRGEIVREDIPLGGHFGVPLTSDCPGFSTPRESGSQ